MPDGVKTRLEKAAEQIADSPIAEKLWGAVKQGAPFIAYPLEAQKELVRQIKEGELKPDEVALTGLGINSELDLSNLIRNLIYDVLNNAVVRETAESLGSVFTEPFIAVLESYSEKEDYDAREMAAAFHGTTMLLKMPQILAKAANNDLQQKLLGDVGDAFDTIYWNLGLGFMGWQTIAPLLSNGLQNKLDRHYKYKFRPQRFSLDTLAYMYTSGQIDKEELREEARYEGWRDNDIVQAIELTFKQLSRGEIADLYQAGVLNLEQVNNEVLKMGYKPEYVSTIVKDILAEETDRDKSVSSAEATKLYSNQLISKSEYSALLEDLGYDDKAVQYKLALADFANKAKQRELTLGQVKSAYVEGVVSRTEVITFIRQQGYDNDSIRTIINTWDAEKAPKILKLNKASILKAFNAGVLSRGEAVRRLRDIGWDTADIKIILDTALVTGAKTTPNVSLSYLMLGLSVGALNESEFLGRVGELGYVDRDARLLLNIAHAQEIPDITEYNIREAYLTKTIDDRRARELLKNLGQEDNAIQLKINTWAATRATYEPSLQVPQLSIMVQQGLLSADQMRTRLVDAGYSQGDANLLVESALGTLPRDLSPNQIQELYYVGVIDDNRALGLLKQVGYSGEEANLLLKGYKAVLQELAPTPTVSQYVSAFRDELLSEPELISKLQNLGFNADAIAFYVNYAKRPEVEVTQKLTKSDILGLYSNGIINKKNAITRLTDLGFSLEDSELLVKGRKVKVQEEEETALFTEGILTPEGLISGLTAKGYSEQDIETALVGG